MKRRVSHAGNVMNATRSAQAGWMVGVALFGASLAWGADGRSVRHSPDASSGGTSIKGQWSADRPRPDGTLHFSIWRSRRGFFQSSSNVPLSQLKGLSREDVMRANAPVRFDIVRDAGTLHCEGRFDSGEGSGDWQFEPDPSFSKGIGIASLADVSPEEQFALAANDVSRAFCAELVANGYADLSYDDVMAFRVHDIDGDYIEALAKAGYGDLPA